MSALKEILERLSGVHVVSEKLDMTMDRVEKLGDWLLDHERRLVALETAAAMTPPAPRPKTRRLPSRKKT
jgi:hypothetical protein